MHEFDITKSQEIEIVDFADMEDLEEVICAGIGGTICGC
jgi:hypothetical protein